MTATSPQPNRSLRSAIVLVSLLLGGCACGSSPGRLDGGLMDDSATFPHDGAPPVDGSDGPVDGAAYGCKDGHAVAVDGSIHGEDGGTLVEVPATDAQLMALRTALFRWGSSHASLPADVTDMVLGVEWAVVGVLGRPGPGRKRYAGPGAFDSYANLEVREAEVLRGVLQDPSQDVYAEIGWPNNLEVDELVEAMPVGARVIVLGDPVREALEEAQMLEEEEGIPAVDCVKPNLLGLPPYGFLVESVDAETHAPLWEAGNQAPLVRDGSDGLAVFEDALDAIRAAAGAAR